MLLYRLSRLALFYYSRTCKRPGQFAAAINDKQRGGTNFAVAQNKAGLDDGDTKSQSITISAHGSTRVAKGCVRLDELYMCMNGGLCDFGHRVCRNPERG